MQKWQYYEVEINVGGFKDNAVGALLSPDGNHQRQREEYAILIAKLGLEGWELVTNIYRVEPGNKQKMNLFFKRPIE
jgi:hypothetical protein